jgi:hypothetical protein
MPQAPPSQVPVKPAQVAWRLRDWIAGFALFASTAGVVLWKDAHVAVLWDLGYVLDSAARIAAGQMPYRDFPLVHAPLTFLIHAAIMRFTGRVYFHHVLYVASVGGIGSVLTWRLALHTLEGHIAAAWAVALLLVAPLVVLGIYCVFPFPSYDCDCAFWMLVGLWLMQRLALNAKSGLRSSREVALAFAAGFALCVPLFFKQNMGLPFLMAAAGAVLLLLFVRLFRRDRAAPGGPSARALLALLCGVAAALIVAVLIFDSTAGIGNYLHWTIGFAAQRRLPGFRDMLGVYLYPSLAWMLPCVVVALALLRTKFGEMRRGQIAAFALLAAPFLFTLLSLLIYDDMDERSDALLELWPLLLLLAGALALVNLVRAWRNPDLRALLPLVLLVAINGTMMSQQLWGSTYAIWPLLVLLLAGMLASFERVSRRATASGWFAPAFAALVSVTLAVCGEFYTLSEDRLSYAQVSDGPALHSAFPQLAGMATPGPYLPEFDELLRYAQANIPFNDGLILIPGEDPFYFATGRVPRFPVLLFDEATDPYSAGEIAALVRSRDIRWLILKRDLQINEDPTPDRDATIQALMGEFTLAARLEGYDVYRR